MLASFLLECFLSKFIVHLADMCAFGQRGAGVKGLDDSRLNEAVDFYLQVGGDHVLSRNHVPLLCIV